jgi:hypothetical protein
MITLDKWKKWRCTSLYTANIVFVWRLKVEQLYFNTLSQVKL